MRITLESELARLRAELDAPPPDPGPPPVASGRRRVRLKTRYMDREALGLVRMPGEVVDLDEGAASEAITKGWAKLVEA